MDGLWQVRNKTPLEAIEVLRKRGKKCNIAKQTAEDTVRRGVEARDMKMLWQKHEVFERDVQ